MEYNLGGIHYSMIKNIIILLVGGSMLLCTSRFWKPEKRKKQELIGGVVAIIFLLYIIGDYYKEVNNPVILSEQGYFFEEDNVRRQLFSKEYTFINEKGKMQTYYLDISNKKKIYPPEFVKDARYRIYYSKGTHIIVKVEEIK